jgi:hypothetical protein
MRTIEEVRERLIRTFEHAFLRPGMWGGSDWHIQESLEDKLKLICWIDEREDHLQSARQCYPSRDVMGIIGDFASQHFNWPSYGNEVASYYAQIVHELGYWHPSRLLDTSDWEHLRESLDESFFERDWTESEVLARFGPSSCTMGGGFSVVHAYAPSISREPWIYFDFARKLRPSNLEEWIADPPLRNVRKQGHIMLPLPFARRSPIGRETIQNDHWTAVEPRLEDHADRERSDIVAVIAEVRQRLPAVVVQRIRFRHGGDIYGAWYFSWKVGGQEIFLSSLVGFAPFFVVVSQPPPASNLKDWARTRDEAVDVVVRHLEQFDRGDCGS